jgi:hypothetical protein
MGWWRYSKYEIEQQRICPSRGGRLERYDPWAEYELGKKRVGESPPYLSLVNMLDEIRQDITIANSTGMPPFPTDPKHPPQLRIPTYVNTFGSGGPFLQSISERAVKRILDWSSRFGLLGVLPQRVLMLQQRKYQSTEPYIRGIATRLAGHYVHTLERTSEDEDSCLLFPKAMEPLAVIAPSVQVLAGFDLKPDPKNPWGFDPEAGDCFWGRYAEPLAEWLAEVEDLSSAIKLGNSTERGDFYAIGAGLNQLLASTGHHLALGAHGMQRELSYPSLLAAYAAMFAQDVLDQQKRIVICPVCGSLAASSAYRRTYCSVKCAWRARKRKQRAKKP